jgi:triacylglycerol esterase/lipase EstA (alpha/beta hydrolase family)
VVASDGQGQSATNSYVQSVNSVAVTHTLTLTTQPAGTPNPAAAASPVALSVGAADSLGHTLSYLWQVSCVEVSGGGSFSPGATAAAPTWTPPANPTGVPLTCLVQVSIYDGLDKTLSASFLQKVNGSTAPAHTLTITTSPNGTPNPVTSGGTTTLAVAAADSLGHPLTYAWSAACPALSGGGQFSPAPSGVSPAWTAPQNLTGEEQTCTLQVTVNDGQGEVVVASYAQRVSSVPHTMTLVSGPTGTPNPVAPGAAVTLSATIADSLNHGISHLWQAGCGGLASSGSFAPSATAPAPVWTPPVHPDGLAFTCVISLNADDGHGRNVQGSYQQNVSAGSAPSHTLSITVPPAGAPNPVGGGATAALSVTAVDSQAHGLSYAWTASCPALPGNGLFAPNATVAAPAWTAPANTTGATQACTIQVVVTDGQGLTQTASYAQSVSAAAGSHSLTITAGPAGTPNPVASSGSAALSVTAVDSLGHTLSYLWQANCAGVTTPGTFAPSAASPSPTWTAPLNPTEGPLSCLVSVTVVDGFGQTATAQYTHTVSPAPHTLTVTTTAAGTPNPVDSGGPAAIVFAAADSLGHALTYAWSADCPGLSGSSSFVPGSNVAQPNWFAPFNYTGAAKTCTLQVTVTDGFGKSASSSYVQTVNPGPVPITVVVQNWVGGPLDVITGTDPITGLPYPITKVPNYAAALYRADETTQVHAADTFSLNGGTDWVLDATFSVGDTMVVKVWRTVNESFGSFFDYPSAKPAWKGDPNKLEIGKKAFTVTADGVFVVRALVDVDQDGMDDFWEQKHSLNPADPTDNTLDLDGDGLSNQVEFGYDTNPRSEDTDGDGVDDKVEHDNGDDPTDVTDWLPPPVRATVGDKSVYLSWNGVLDVPAAVLSVTRVGSADTYDPITLDPKAGGIRLTSLKQTGVVDPVALVNDASYEFRLVLTRGAVTRTPPAGEVITARPTALAPGDPVNPIVFLHGFGGTGDAAGAFAEPIDFATRTLGWTFGGRFCFPGTSLVPAVDTNLAGATVRTTVTPGVGPTGSANCTGLGTAPSATGDFFTVDFGHNFANYGVDPALGGGLFHQAAEVDKVVDVLFPVVGPVALVGQGNGGLAARYFLHKTSNVDGAVEKLVTYGSAHRGADTAYWCQAALDPNVTTMGGAFDRLVKGLTASGGCTNPAAVGGVRDVQFTCDDTGPQMSAFLSPSPLLPDQLPDNVAYTAIVSGWQAHGWNAALLPNGGVRGTDCLSTEWDGLVPRSSADLNETPLLVSPAKVLSSERFTEAEGADIASIFCALSNACAVLRADAPVDVVLTAPSGRQMARTVSELPGAGFMTPVETDGALSTIVVPFAESGSYQVVVTARPGYLPSARYSIRLVLGGSATTVASSHTVQSIIDAGGSRTYSFSIP